MHTSITNTLLLLTLSFSPLALSNPNPAPIVTISVPAYVPGVSKCAGQPVFDSCYASTSAIASGCASTDYNCLCEKWNEVMGCFLSCPNDPRHPAALAYRTTYCSNAVTYGTTSQAPISRPVSTSATATPTASSESENNDEATATTGTSTGARASQTANMANGLMMGSGKGRVGVAGGVLVGVAGVVGLFL